MAKNEDDAPLFPVMTGGKNFKSDFYERVPFQMVNLIVQKLSTA